MAVALTEVTQRTEAPESVPVTLVDCDVHPAPAGKQELLQFMPKRWHYLEKVPVGVPYRLDVVNDGARVDARPKDFALGMAGANPELFRRQLLEEAGVDFAVLIYHTSQNPPAPDADAARCSAINEWMAAYWLERYNDHGRYRGSIRLPMHNPGAAVAELDRWADHPGFVQAMAVGSYSPAFGHPAYEPIFRVAAERGLPFAIHPANWPIVDPSPVGPWTYFFEWHSQAAPTAYTSHLASMVCNGLFERLPDLKVVFVEGGLSWSHALANHLDRCWVRLKAEVPALTLAPSEYLGRQTYFSTQPAEEPQNPAALVQILNRMGGRDRVMFSTDYPHFDYDDPRTALPRAMDDDLRRKIMSETACALYGLPRTRAVAA
jgi:uncharacterized protein